MLCKKLLILQESALQHLISCMLGILSIFSQGSRHAANCSCLLQHIVQKFPSEYFGSSFSFLRT